MSIFRGREQELKADVSKRIPYSSIAAKFNCTSGAVSSAVARLGIGLGRRPARSVRMAPRRAATTLTVDAIKAAAGPDRKPDARHARALILYDAEREHRQDLVKTELLLDGDCRFPVGEVGTPEFGHCGAPLVRGTSYCAFHLNHCAPGIAKRLGVFTCEAA